MLTDIVTDKVRSNFSSLANNWMASDGITVLEPLVETLGVLEDFYFDACASKTIAKWTETNLVDALMRTAREVITSPVTASQVISAILADAQTNAALRTFMDAEVHDAVARETRNIHSVYSVA